MTESTTVPVLKRVGKVTISHEPILFERPIDTENMRVSKLLFASVGGATKMILIKGMLNMITNTFHEDRDSQEKNDADYRKWNIDPIKLIEKRK